MTDYERGVTDAIAIMHWHSRHWGIVHASQPHLIERDLREYLLSPVEVDEPPYFHLGIEADGFITVHPKIA